MDFSNLRGEIKKKYRRQSDFAAQIGINPASLSAKLNGKSEWTSEEILNTCNLLNIQLDEAWKYFFTPKVEKTQRD
jgi:transcriptional regulator with XRE-family HTH domain